MGIGVEAPQASASLGHRPPGPGWLAAPPLTPVCLCPSRSPGGDAGRLGADLRLLPRLSLPRGLGASTPPRQRPPC